MNKSTGINNREEWLLIAIEHLRPLFQGQGHKIPNVKVSCSWPSSGALGRVRRNTGEYWAPEVTKDGIPQVFISPLLDEVSTEQGVLAVLTHELCHVVLGPEAKHGKKFCNLMERLGMMPKFTESHAGDSLQSKFEQIEQSLGNYPHGAICPKEKIQKKQSTRLLKSECEHCGYTVRVTQKWLDVGPPHCPMHGAMFVEQPKEDDED